VPDVTMEDTTRQLRDMPPLIGDIASACDSMMGRLEAVRGMETQGLIEGRRPTEGFEEEYTNVGRMIDEMASHVGGLGGASREEMRALSQGVSGLEAMAPGGAVLPGEIVSGEGAGFLGGLVQFADRLAPDASTFLGQVIDFAKAIGPAASTMLTFNRQFQDFTQAADRLSAGAFGPLAGEMGDFSSAFKNLISLRPASAYADIIQMGARGAELTEQTWMQTTHPEMMLELSGWTKQEADYATQVMRQFGMQPGMIGGGDPQMARPEIFWEIGRNFGAQDRGDWQGLATGLSKMDLRPEDVPILEMMFGPEAMQGVMQMRAQAAGDPEGLGQSMAELNRLHRIQLESQQQVAQSETDRQVSWARHEAGRAAAQARARLGIDELISSDNPIVGILGTLGRFLGAEWLSTLLYGHEATADPEGFLRGTEQWRRYFQGEGERPNEGGIAAFEGAVARGTAAGVADGLARSPQTVKMDGKTVGNVVGTQMGDQMYRSIVAGP